MDTEAVLARLTWDVQALDAAANWGVSREDAEAVIRGDERPALDPHAAEVGYPIFRFRSGDVVVVVGFREPEAPRVIHVHVHTPGEPTYRGGARRGGIGQTMPTSQRDLKRRILGLGYRLQVSGSGHLFVIDPETGERVAGISSTPKGGRGLADDWTRFLKAHSRRNP